MEPFWGQIAPKTKVEVRLMLLFFQVPSPVQLQVHRIHTGKDDELVLETDAPSTDVSFYSYTKPLRLITKLRQQLLRFQAQNVAKSVSCSFPSVDLHTLLASNTPITELTNDQTESSLSATISLTSLVIDSSTIKQGSWSFNFSIDCTSLQTQADTCAVLCDFAKSDGTLVWRCCPMAVQSTCEWESEVIPARMLRSLPNGEIQVVLSMIHSPGTVEKLATGTLTWNDEVGVNAATKTVLHSLSESSSYKFTVRSCNKTNFTLSGSSNSSKSSNVAIQPTSQAATEPSSKSTTVQVSMATESTLSTGQTSTSPLTTTEPSGVQTSTSVEPPIPKTADTGSSHLVSADAPKLHQNKAASKTPAPPPPAPKMPARHPPKNEASVRPENTQPEVKPSTTPNTPPIQEELASKMPDTPVQSSKTMGSPTRKTSGSTTQSSEITTKQSTLNENSNHKLSSEKTSVPDAPIASTVSSSMSQHRTAQTTSSNKRVPVAPPIPKAAVSPFVKKPTRHTPPALPKRAETNSIAKSTRATSAISTKSVQSKPIPSSPGKTVPTGLKPSPPLSRRRTATPPAPARPVAPPKPVVPVAKPVADSPSSQIEANRTTDASPQNPHDVKTSTGLNTNSDVIVAEPSQPSISDNETSASLTINTDVQHITKTSIKTSDGMNEKNDSHASKPYDAPSIPCTTDSHVVNDPVTTSETNAAHVQTALTSGTTSVDVTTPSAMTVQAPTHSDDDGSQVIVAGTDQDSKLYSIDNKQSRVISSGMGEQRSTTTTSSTKAAEMDASLKQGHRSSFPLVQNIEKDDLPSATGKETQSDKATSKASTEDMSTTNNDDLAKVSHPTSSVNKHYSETTKMDNATSISSTQTLTGISKPLQASKTNSDPTTSISNTQMLTGISMPLQALKTNSDGATSMSTSTTTTADVTDACQITSTMPEPSKTDVTNSASATKSDIKTTDSPVSVISTSQSDVPKLTVPESPREGSASEEQVQTQTPTSETDVDNTVKFRRLTRRPLISNGPLSLDNAKSALPTRTRSFSGQELSEDGTPLVRPKGVHQKFAGANPMSRFGASRSRSYRQSALGEYYDAGGSSDRQPMTAYQRARLELQKTGLKIDKDIGKGKSKPQRAAERSPLNSLDRNRSKSFRLPSTDAKEHVSGFKMKAGHAANITDSRTKKDMPNRQPSKSLFKAQSSPSIPISGRPENVSVSAADTNSHTMSAAKCCVSLSTTTSTTTTPNIHTKDATMTSQPLTTTAATSNVRSEATEGDATQSITQNTTATGEKIDVTASNTEHALSQRSSIAHATPLSNSDEVALTMNSLLPPIAEESSISNSRAEKATDDFNVSSDNNGSELSRGPESDVVSTGYPASCDEELQTSNHSKQSKHHSNSCIQIVVTESQNDTPVSVKPNVNIGENHSTVPKSADVDETTHKADISSIVNSSIKEAEYSGTLTVPTVSEQLTISVACTSDSMGIHDSGTSDSMDIHHSGTSDSMDIHHHVLQGHTTHEQAESKHKQHRNPNSLTSSALEANTQGLTLHDTSINDIPPPQGKAHIPHTPTTSDMKMTQSLSNSTNLKPPTVSDISIDNVDQPEQNATVVVSKSDQNQVVTTPKANPDVSKKEIDSINLKNETTQSLHHTDKINVTSSRTSTTTTSYVQSSEQNHILSPTIGSTKPDLQDDIPAVGNISSASTSVMHDSDVNTSEKHVSSNASAFTPSPAISQSPVASPYVNQRRREISPEFIYSRSHTEKQIELGRASRRAQLKISEQTLHRAHTQQQHLVSASPFSQNDTRPSFKFTSPQLSSWTFSVPSPYETPLMQTNRSTKRTQRASATSPRSPKANDSKHTKMRTRKPAADSTEVTIHSSTIASTILEWEHALASSLSSGARHLQRLAQHIEEVGSVLQSSSGFDQFTKATVSDVLAQEKKRLGDYRDFNVVQAVQDVVQSKYEHNSSHQITNPQLMEVLRAVNLVSRCQNEDDVLSMYSHSSEALTKHKTRQFASLLLRCVMNHQALKTMRSQWALVYSPEALANQLSLDQARIAAEHQNAEQIYRALDQSVSEACAAESNVAGRFGRTIGQTDEAIVPNDIMWETENPIVMRGSVLLEKDIPSIVDAINRLKKGIAQYKDISSADAAVASSYFPTVFDSYSPSTLKVLSDAYTQVLQRHADTLKAARVDVYNCQNVCTQRRKELESLEHEKDNVTNEISELRGNVQQLVSEHADRTRNIVDSLLSSDICGIPFPKVIANLTNSANHGNEAHLYAESALKVLTASDDEFATYSGRLQAEMLRQAEQDTITKIDAEYEPKLLQTHSKSQARLEAYRDEASNQIRQLSSVGWLEDRRSQDQTKLNEISKEIQRLRQKQMELQSKMRSTEISTTVLSRHSQHIYRLIALKSGVRGQWKEMKALTPASPQDRHHQIWSLTEVSYRRKLLSELLRKAPFSDKALSTLRHCEAEIRELAVTMQGVGPRIRPATSRNTGKKYVETAHSLSHKKSETATLDKGKQFSFEDVMGEKVRRRLRLNDTTISDSSIHDVLHQSRYTREQAQFARMS